MKKNHWFFRAAGILAAVILAACPTGGGGSNPPAQTAQVAMVNIPGGRFQMGSPAGTLDSEDDEHPVHEVTLSPFKISRYEVTQGQWYEVMGTRPSQFTENPEDTGPEGWKTLPVEQVSWYDALVFCNLLSMRENLTPVYSIGGSTDPDSWGPVPEGIDPTPTWDSVSMDASATGYRLPTEAQWEYAARGGNDSPGGYTYAGSDTVDDVAWYDENSNEMTHKVGKKAPNGLGLYDMSGNVYEWCWDWYGSYSDGPQTNPMGAPPAANRVFRGGSYYDNAQSARSAYRYLNIYPAARVEHLGFRIVRP